jgi:hypothetical protein
MNTFPFNKIHKHWIIKYSKTNYWRVRAWMDFDDLIHEGIAAYYEVRHRYPDAVEVPHIQHLLMKVMRSRVEHIIRRHYKQADVYVDSTVVERYDGVTEDMTEIHAKLLETPIAVRDLLSALVSPAGDVEEKGYRDSLHERLCRILDKDPKRNRASTIVRTYFATI